MLTRENVAPKITKIQSTKTKIKRRNLVPSTVAQPEPKPLVDQQVEAIATAAAELPHPVPEKSAVALTRLSQDAENTQPASQNEIRAEDGYVREHLEEIRRLVMANLHYPALAKRQGWAGRVQVRFTILLSGDIETPEILQSSGFSLLDQKALEAIETAAPYPHPPVVATITIPMVFELQ